jgi:4-hydroxy-tetrahydrodipicolinate synthase
MRAPTLRVPDRIMQSLRAGLHRAGLPVTDDPDHAYLVGRHPA